MNCSSPVLQGVYLKISSNLGSFLMDPNLCCTVIGYDINASGDRKGCILGMFD